MVQIQTDEKLGTIVGISYSKGALYVAASSRKLILKLTPINSK
jgi:hypothetical protein